MWPKAFSQLVELAPHISRLLPMADRYFQAKAADDAGRSAAEGLAESLRRDVAQMHAGQASLQRQLTSVAESLAANGAQVRETRSAAESAAKSSAAAAQAAADSARSGAETAKSIVEAAMSAEAHTTNVEERLTGLERELGKIADRSRMSPIVFMLVLANLILLACVIMLLVHGSR